MPYARADIGREFTCGVVARVEDGGTLSYQWQWVARGGTWADITTASGRTASLTHSFATDGSYSVRCVVTNTRDGQTATAISASISVTINAPPVAPPQVPTVTLLSSPSVNGLTSREFTCRVSASVTDGGTLSYQWQYRYDLITGTTWTNIASPTATTDSLTILFIFPGTYELRCVVTNTRGGQTATANSQVINVFLTQGGPLEPTVTITAPALNNTIVTRNQEMTFSVSASAPDGGTLSYQWQWRLSGGDWANMTAGGVTGARTETMRATFPGAIGAVYELRCVVTNTRDGQTSSTNSTIVTVSIVG